MSGNPHTLRVQGQVRGADGDWVEVPDDAHADEWVVKRGDEVLSAFQNREQALAWAARQQVIESLRPPKR